MPEIVGCVTKLPTRMSKDMPENQPVENPMANTHRWSRRIFRFLLLAIAIGIGVWHVAQTEHRLSQSKRRGISDDVISILRYEAYLPLAGGYIGALVAVGIAYTVKRARKPARDNVQDSN